MKKKSFLRFDIVSKQIIYPFLIPIFVCFRIVMINGINENGFTTASHPFIIIMFMFTGELASGILEVISFFLSRKKKIMKDKRMSSADLILNKSFRYPYGNENWKGFLYGSVFNYSMICLAALIDFINMTGLMLIPGQATAYQNQNLEYEMKIVQIIFTSLLSYLVLKVKVFKHQYLAIVLIIVGIGLLMIEQEIDNFIAIPFYLLFFCSSSFQEVIEKWSIEKRSTSTFKILFCEGVFGIFLCNMGIVISSTIQCRWDFCKNNNTFNTMESYYEGFSALFFNSINGLFLFGYIVGSFSLNNSTMLTSKHFTATHRTVSDSLAAFIWGIISLMQGYSIHFNLLIQIPSYIIITIGCLIYNEIVILAFCNLEENTKKEITERHKTEFSNISIELTDFSKDEMLNDSVKLTDKFKNEKEGAMEENGEQE